VFLVHGEGNASKSLAEKIQKTLRWKDVTVPAQGDHVLLDF